MIYLGIDTSCYTTSLAAVDEDGVIVADRRIPLEVEPGKKGLRQSHMVFQHIKNLAQIAESFPGKVAAVAASAAPRPAEDSYMPVFAVSESAGKLMAASAGAKFYSLTHQHGHIGAALLDKPEIPEGEMLGLHLSGGTTELLRIVVCRGIIHEIETIGGTKDISCGQLLDRTANHLGLPFPGGPELEKIATVPEPMRVSVRGMRCNLSGAETALKKLRISGMPEGVVAATAQEVVRNTVLELIANAKHITGIRRVLLFGGVIRNMYLRKSLRDPDIIFAEKQYPSDNACGLADQAAKLFKSGL